MSEKIGAHGLTHRQKAFADLFVDLGGRFQGRAAIMAGIAEAGADSWASRTIRLPAVLRYLRSRTEAALTKEIVASSETLRQIRDDLSAPPGERRKCAESLLDRGGLMLQRVSTVNHVIEDRRETPDQLAANMVGLYSDLLMELQQAGVVTFDRARLDHWLQHRQESLKLLAQREADTLDGEYSVLDEDEADRISDLSGLEDVA